MPDQRIDIKREDFHFSDVPFEGLMRRRIYRVLLVASAYDAFILEEDGRIDEQIFNEYTSLNLRYPPRFIQASSAAEAFSIMERENIDLVINMLSIGDMDPFRLGREIKDRYPDKPLVILTPFSREVSQKLRKEDTGWVDYIFCWLGNTDLLLAIIKLIEDKMNAQADILDTGVQAILLVEDSIRFYSSYLPHLYKIIFSQSKSFMSEGLNQHQRMLRMRGRPKIMLATNYKEALYVFDKYRNNLLGIISDVSFEREGAKDKQAGFRLLDYIKKNDQYVPVLMQSSESENEKRSADLGVGFIHKRSKTISHDLREYIIRNFSFGEFVFVDPKDGSEADRARDLKDLQEVIMRLPDRSLRYHISKNDFSKWLNARALFQIAELIRHLRLDDFEDLSDIRRFLYNSISSFRRQKAKGVIAKFYRNKYDEYLTFARLGEGSMGGKARGLAFIDAIIKKHGLVDKYPSVHLSIPRTLVICTDVFDRFMADNQLYHIALSDKNDEEILEAFIKAKLPHSTKRDLLSFITYISKPLAIRSSSLLEDSHYQPFAGIYSTYMVPNIGQDKEAMLEMISTAIKSVYASVFFKDSKAYMEATSNVIDEEKMALVIQEVCGRQYGERFYPTFSGVGRSINFYPIGPEKPEDGIVNVAAGLGKMIVEGGQSLRFSPRYPKNILQQNTAEMTLRESQKHFFALDLNPQSFTSSTDDGVNLKKLRIKEAERDGSIEEIASVYDFSDNSFREGRHYEGKRVITFANILKYDSYPLSTILCDILSLGQKEMNNPVEIEFAMDLPDKQGGLAEFYLLQIRPIVDNSESISTDPGEIAEQECIIKSASALGNGEIEGLQDIIYVRPETFDAANNPAIAEQIDKLNRQLLDENRHCVLIAPGRWGSSDPWLGVPVKWSQISSARLMVEAGLDNYRVDPSQGTHFFQNLTSLRVGYLTINPYMNDGYWDVAYLNKQKAQYEDEHLRHIRFEKPAKALIDGKKKSAALLKPD